MYFKVALIFVLGIFFSGCSFTNTPKPKEPKLENNITTIIDDNSTIIPIKKNKIIEKKENRYNLKPEPFSLENNENDPELLGPQSTLDRGLEEDEIDNIETKQKNKESIKNAKDNSKLKKEEKI